MDFWYFPEAESTCTSRLVVQHPCQLSFKSMQGCRRSWEDKLWWAGRTEWRNDGMSDKANIKCPLAILWRGHKKNYGTMWKVLSQGVHMCNIKALFLLVRKLWPRLIFFKSRSSFKVKVTMSKIMVPCERSWHNEYTYEIRRLYI